jgi:hypothetical protein
MGSSFKAKAKARALERRRRAALRRTPTFRLPPGVSPGDCEILPPDMYPLNARGLQSILDLTGITPEDIELWSAERVFPVSGTTAGTVERWLSGDAAITEEVEDFFLDRRRDFLLEAEDACKWHVAEMRRVHGDHGRHYKANRLIFDDVSLLRKYFDRKGLNKLSLSVYRAFWKVLASHLASKGIETRPVTFVESEYLAYLAKRGEDHSFERLREWTMEKAERTCLAKDGEKAKARDVGEDAPASGPSDRLADGSD